MYNLYKESGRMSNRLSIRLDDETFSQIMDLVEYQKITGDGKVVYERSFRPYKKAERKLNKFTDLDSKNPKTVIVQAIKEMHEKYCKY